MALNISVVTNYAQDNLTSRRDNALNASLGSDGAVIYDVWQTAIARYKADAYWRGQYVRIEGNVEDVDGLFEVMK